MINRTILAREALRAAVELRGKLSIPVDVPVCIYDVAKKLDVDVRFIEGDSFDGMYSKDFGVILVPSFRPYGRQAFSCAHELGHWHFKHGARLDLLLDNTLCAVKSDEEFLADTFAGHMLMPTWAVKRMFLSRGLRPDTCSHIELYRISCQLGVGYETLIDHLYYSLKKLSPEARERLLKATPKSIREEILGREAAGVRHLALVDAAWETVAVDLQVGDVAVVERSERVDGVSVVPGGRVRMGQVIKAVRPGVSTISSEDGSWSAYIRVSRKDFVGRSDYRHLGDPDVD
ncbi:MAG: hypothetical protein A2270_08045 [Elusimicrobia bacterium RIFOXYA12_FULL_51_18]|nr:MAG: hypothetical protein A2270_08045 [Elusimicrobia bacterium RIFOXYA12_FULL_51_18]OGS28559.1 MAG: hypothetical protein A2218_04945 [Elusimicrobia bacterium RIFOXYA2_FULL_53_38]